MGQSSYIMSKCPSGVLIDDTCKVSKRLNLKEFCILCKSKIKSLKVDKNIASNKLFGIKYNFQDWKTIVEEAHEKLIEVEQVFTKTQQQGLPTMDMVHATKHLPFFLHVTLYFITTNNLLHKVYVELDILLHCPYILWEQFGQVAKGVVIHGMC